MLRQFLPEVGILLICVAVLLSDHPLGDLGHQLLVCRYLLGHLLSGQFCFGLWGIMDLLLLLSVDYELVELLHELLVADPLPLPRVVGLAHALDLAGFMIVGIDLMKPGIS